MKLNENDENYQPSLVSLPKVGGEENHPRELAEEKSSQKEQIDPMRTKS
jgi:hypothetical protein